MKYTAKQALIDYLSQQPDRTALGRDCQRAVAGLMGRKMARNTLNKAKLELGITHRFGSIGGAPGESFVAWWTLPARWDSSVKTSDHQMAERLVAIYAAGGGTEFTKAMDEARSRLEQVTTVLIQMAAEERGGV